MTPRAPQISSRLEQIRPSATLKVDQKAKALKAEGRPVISFAAGEPDFPTPAHVVEAAVDAVRDPKNHRYTPAVGLPELRAAIFAGMQQTLAPGGLLLLHGFTPAQLAYGTGGPPCAELLYTPDLLRDAFAQMEILQLEEYERELQEGTGHAGHAALIDLVARKPG